MQICKSYFTKPHIAFSEKKKLKYKNENHEKIKKAIEIPGKRNEKQNIF